MPGLRERQEKCASPQPSFLGLNMNPWQFIKRRFQRRNNKDHGEKIVTRQVELAFSLLQGSNYIEARGLLLRTLEYKSEIQNPILVEWILISLSRTWEETEEYQKWTDFFSDFIAQNPNEALAYHLRAESHWYGGSLNEAIADYSRALELNPKDASAFLGRGQVFMECRDFSRALEDLDAALGSIDSIPGADAVWKVDFEAFARNGRAATYAGVGDFGRALEEFDKSINLCPENAWVYYNRAEAYQNLGDQRNAVENYKLALAKKGPKLTSLKRARAESVVNVSRA
jgi:tetratricopeptide (TPR) repeat protein